MTILKAVLVGACLALGAGVVDIAAASADTRCAAVAIRANGERLSETRATETARSERRACRVAVDVCERRLDRLRYAIGRRLPFARCEVVRVVDLGGRYGGGYDDRYDDHTGRYDDRRGYDDRAPRDGYACDYRACADAYRSFRASDCTFQPFEGPRRLCAQ